MFGTQTRVLILALVLCSVATNAATSILKASFEETRKDKPNAVSKGTLYYLYDDGNRNNCRLYMEYKLPGDYIIKNLQYYPDNATYSMCSTDTCTGLRNTESPDPWYYDDKVYDKGSDYDSSHKWYTRKALSGSSGFTAQVKMIAMGAEKTANTDIKKIVFEDGRNWTLTDVKLNPSGITKDSDIFKKMSSCPKPTCPIYADLVFVLDNSGSVDDKEWKKTAKFVAAVMDSFTFGIDAVEAAIIQFNAPHYKSSCPTKKVDDCNQCSGDYDFYTSDYRKNKKDYHVSLPGYCTAEVIAGQDYGKGLTVTTERSSLANTIVNGSRPDKIGNTCQGYGLEIAMKVLDRSPRKDYSKKPNNIVIVVTDGADFCPNRTADAAAKLQKKRADGGYEAFVIEIGVGMDKSCNNYDRHFLERIASKVGSSDTPAYYSVDNYDAIHQVTEQLFRPLCDDFNTECGPDCQGFCGCGKCYCPECVTPASTCEQNTCRADSNHTSSTGCVNEVKPCPKGDVCTTYTCDGTKPDTERCVAHANPCQEWKDKNRGTCREVLCSTSKTGGCYVSINDNYCQREFGNACIDFECTPENETISDADFQLYRESGCRPKAGTNKTAIKEQELIESGKITCFRATCNANGATGEEDICVHDTPKCYNTACTKTGEKKYECVPTEKKHPKDTQCETYTCNPDEGWVLKSHKDEQICITEIEEKGNSTKCQKVYCDPAVGCQMEKIPNCDTGCSDENFTTCAAEGYQQSNVTYCILGTCTIVEDQGDPALSHAVCDNSTFTNCVVDLADEIAQLNEDFPERCYNPVCTGTGQCIKEYKEVPDDMPETKCMKAVCVKDEESGMWHWEYHPTKTNTTCQSDACSDRVCDPDYGCNETDICKVKTNECVSFYCDISGEKPECKYTNATFIETECTKEICDEGKKVLFQKNVTEVCKVPNKCYEPFCQDGKCNYTEKIAPDDDPCVIYTCNPETGIFESVPKCDDGLYCTENQCTIFGECKYQPISCDGALDMSGYPCFEPRCKEVPDEKRYKCVRKLIRNAYLDVCGRCIQEKVESNEQSTSSSSSFSSLDEKEKEFDTTSCTGAPAKPILTEGLAAASIALIIVGAVIVGAAITTSSVMGTKTLLNRAKNANDQSAHNNPLFEGNETELNNPTYAGN